MTRGAPTSSTCVPAAALRLNFVHRRLPNRKLGIMKLLETRHKATPFLSVNLMPLSFRALRGHSERSEESRSGKSKSQTFLAFDS